MDHMKGLLSRKLARNIWAMVVCGAYATIPVTTVLGRRLMNNLLFTLLTMLIAQQAMLEHSVSTKNRTDLLLRGKVNSIKIAPVDRSSVVIIVDLKMELVNVGTRPIILLRDEPEFPGAVLAASPEDMSTDKFVASRYEGQSTSNAPEWGRLRDSLDKAAPPPEKTRVLNPGESWPLDASTRFVVPLTDSDVHHDIWYKG